MSENGEFKEFHGIEVVFRSMACGLSVLGKKLVAPLVGRMISGICTETVHECYWNTFDWRLVISLFIDNIMVSLFEVDEVDQVPRCEAIDKKGWKTGSSRLLHVLPSFTWGVVLPYHAI